MRILMITAEGPPLARATALVDVLEALPRELRARQHEVAITRHFARDLHVAAFVGLEQCVAAAPAKRADGGTALK